MDVMPVFTSTTHCFHVKRVIRLLVLWRFPYTWLILTMVTLGTMLYSNCKSLSECLLTSLAGRDCDGCGCWLTQSPSVLMQLLCAWVDLGRETSGSGSAVHHTWLWLHNSLLWNWELSGRQTVSSALFELLSGVSVCVGVPAIWQSACMFGCCSACDYTCTKDPVMMPVPAPGAGKDLSFSVKIHIGPWHVSLCFCSRDSWLPISEFCKEFCYLQIVCTESWLFLSLSLSLYMGGIIFSAMEIGGMASFTGSLSRDFVDSATGPDYLSKKMIAF